MTNYKKYTCVECKEDKWRRIESKDFPWCYDCFQQLYKYNCKKCNKKMKKEFPLCYNCKISKKIKKTVDTTEDYDIDCIVCQDTGICYMFEDEYGPCQDCNRGEKYT